MSSIDIAGVVIVCTFIIACAVVGIFAMWIYRDK